MGSVQMFLKNILKKIVIDDLKSKKRGENICAIKYGFKKTIKEQCSKINPGVTY